MILLDTHVLIWLISDVERLSKPAIREVQKARNAGEAISISSISLLETASLVEKKRISITLPLQPFLESLESSFNVLPLTSRSCAKTTELPPGYPRDPADRIIGATALTEGLTLITADHNIIRSRAVPVVW